MAARPDRPPPGRPGTLAAQTSGTQPAKLVAGSPANRGVRRRREPATSEATARQQTGSSRSPLSPAPQRRSPAVLAGKPTPPTAAGDRPAEVRISKLMAERGLCSRRDADAYIARGWVFVDGRRVSELGSRAAPSAVITLDRRALAAQEACLTILLHKPVGYVSGQPEPGCKPAVALIQPERQFRTADTPAFHPSCLRGLAPAGRLDVDSTGLLVLTQDGRVARQLVGEDSTIDKEYLVRVEGQLADGGLALLNHGLSLDDRRLKPARVQWLNADQLRFVLREGRKRQIRRMCELVGLRVLGLKRVRIGAVRLGDLPLGQWRFLRPDEVF